MSHLARVSLYFGDLDFSARSEVSAQLCTALQENGAVEKADDESHADYNRRLWEEVEDYINCHNMAVEYHI